MDETYVLEKRNKVMENTQLKKDFTKVKNIITSCNNKDQLRVAEKKIPGISEVIPTLHLHQSKFEDDRNLGELLLKNPTYSE